MPSRSWIQVSIKLPLALHDLLTGQLSLMGFNGFQQEESSLLCFIDRNRWNQTVKRRMMETLERFNKELAPADLTWTAHLVREQNWNARWERSIGIVEATTRIIIKPSWRKLRKRDKGKIVLHIDPKMSFGTGHHETTRLCLTLLQEHIKNGVKILDVGSGTGVLSIAAVKLGASAAVGIDNDPWAVLNARENILRNKVRRSVNIRRGTSDRLPRGRFGLVVSNIDLRSNLLILPAILKKLSDDGVIILSGFLTSDLRALLDNLKGKKAVPLEILEENEWVAIALGKADAAERH